MRLSSRGIEPLVDVIQFFYREPPLPIGSPALKNNTNTNTNTFLTILTLFTFLMSTQKSDIFEKTMNFRKSRI